MKAVFITGASSGLGAALGLVGRRMDALQALSASLGGGYRCHALDVRDRAALHAAAQDFLVHIQGRIDVVIATAGISVGTLTEYSEDFEVFQAILDTNVPATVSIFEPFIAAMWRAHAGRLVGVPAWQVPITRPTLPWRRIAKAATGVGRRRRTRDDVGTRIYLHAHERS